MRAQVLSVRDMTGIGDVGKIAGALQVLQTMDPRVVETLGNMDPKILEQLSASDQGSQQEGQTAIQGVIGALLSGKTDINSVQNILQQQGRQQVPGAPPRMRMMEPLGPRLPQAGPPPPLQGAPLMAFPTSMPPPTVLPIPGAIPAGLPGSFLHPQQPLHMVPLVPISAPMQAPGMWPGAGRGNLLGKRPPGPRNEPFPKRRR